MKNNKMISHFQYVPKIWSTLVFFLLLAGVYFLFMGRKKEGLRIQFLLDIFPDFYSHVSNFAISFLICLVAGYMGIMQTRKMSFVFVMGVLLILANFIYEWFVPMLNTMDKVDAYYGFAGTILPFVFFFFYRKYGLMPNPYFKVES